MGGNKLTITVTGSGTSQGVPVIACSCEVCLSNNPKDKRLRSSIHIQSDFTSLVIDSGPDFRQQMLNNNIKDLSAILFTHEHKDHIAGLDDVRAFNYILQKPIDVFCTNRVKKALHREYHYIFDPKFKYPGIPKVNCITIKNDEIFKINDLKIEPIEAFHYKLPVLGFRINNFAYVTDANKIEHKEKKKLLRLEVLIINALRIEKHISHFNLKEALSLIKELQPKKAFLTHISHLMGKHENISHQLPNNVTIAHDGLIIKV